MSHYLTPLSLHYLYDIIQRLYYLPIILAAIWYGLRGGRLFLAASIVYAPHKLFQWGGHLTLELENMGNGEKLRQAFLNITINFLQATQSGGSLTISSSVCQGSGAVGLCEIRFCDS